MRFPPTKILVPMNTSDTSMTAWLQARDLARAFGADLEAIYVHDWTAEAMGLPIAGASPAAPTSVELAAIIQRRIGAGSVLHHVTGFTVDQIPSWAQQHHFDLLVIGTHGRGGISRALMGSLAESIVRHSNIPVLVSRVLVSHWDRVVAPISEKPRSWEGLLDAAVVATRLGLPLAVVHVVESPVYGDRAAFSGVKKELRVEIERLPAELRRVCRPQPSIAFGDPPTEIAAAAGEHGLIVLRAHPRRYLAERILGTIAERVLRHAPQSVLAIPSDAVSDEERSQASRTHAVVF